ncbi:MULTISPECIES: hypothetical protein [Streptomyces]|uniref:hypothetical protein n=1 Tax=Streptomyces TaxID=1883 RepID=UPI0004AB482E|nr:MULTISPECIES: hypothetical protein [Streptomyces]
MSGHEELTTNRLSLRRPANLASRRVALRAGLRRVEHLDGEGCDGFDLIYANNLPRLGSRGDCQ